jgi:proline dehydrogenase
LKVDFNNTEIAFKSKSNKDLRRAHRLFKMVGRNWLVRIGKWATNIALKLRLLPIGIIKRTIFKQFCGGEDIQDCKETIDELAAYKVGTILDYSVEGKKSAGDLDATKDELIRSIREGKGNKNIPFAVFKYTGICRFGLLEKANESTSALDEKELAEFERFVDRVKQICAAAQECDTPVFVDAEESWIQDAIDRVTEEMMCEFNKEKVYVYNTIQLYRHDKLDYLKDCHDRMKAEGVKCGFKLVRGAYMEKERARAKELSYESPIQANKDLADKDYDQAVLYCLEHLEDIAICAGTHNETSSKLLADKIQELNIPLDHPHIYFAQLLGMSDHISYNLTHLGYNVAKYVPYGPVREVMPYLLRRAQENTSVKGQTGRELALIKKELKRRKLA